MQALMDTSLIKLSIYRLYPYRIIALLLKEEQCIFCIILIYLLSGAFIIPQYDSIAGTQVFPPSS